MEGPRLFDRREFTLASALAVLSGVAITVSGCGGGSPASPSPTPGAGSSNEKVGTVSANHGHSAVITSAQLTAAGTLSLNIQGSATHPHLVDLTAGDVAAIAGSQRVARTSSTDNGHAHTVTFN